MNVGTILNSHSIFPKLLVIFLILVFIFLPMLRRSNEKGRVSLFTCRVPLLLYERRTPLGVMRSGGNFYRVTIYDDFMVAVFFINQIIYIKDIDTCIVMKKIIPQAEIKVGKITVRVFASRRKLEAMASVLMARKKITIHQR